jgi:LemA protein
MVWGILGLTAGIIFFVVAVYNNLVRLRNYVKNALAQIDVQLTRRYELIPNLVEVAKKVMSHERETLEAVIQARNMAHNAQQKVNGNPSNTDAVKELQQAETQLTSQVSRMMLLVENYPDLKANQNMTTLMEELTSTENKVSFSRQAYNDAVMSYNNGIEVFPNNIFAGMFSFMPFEFLKVDNEEVKKPLKVSFN